MLYCLWIFAKAGISSSLAFLITILEGLFSGEGSFSGEGLFSGKRLLSGEVLFAEIFFDSQNRVYTAQAKSLPKP